MYFLLYTCASLSGLCKFSSPLPPVPASCEPYCTVHCRIIRPTIAYHSLQRLHCRRCALRLW